ncbi:MAG: hypothetical protein HY841_00520 [Bacteroidetes bacterium]|nr:hypothetical protein [Bacteroidota bacterium]
MKTVKTIFPAALAAIFFMAGYSCNKENNTMMNKNKTSSLSSLTLTAEQTTLSSNGTTKITASGVNVKSCCSLSYTWSASAGNITGNSAEITYKVPANSGQQTITCLAKDGCGKSQSKSIAITVQ